MTRYLGGLITKDESLVIPADNYQETSAPGVWTLEEAQMLAKQGLWPTAGVSAQHVFISGVTSRRALERIDLASSGGASDFGEIRSGAGQSGGDISVRAGFGNGTRGIWSSIADNYGSSTDIEYFTFA